MVRLRTVLEHSRFVDGSQVNCYASCMPDQSHLEDVRGFDVWLDVGRTNLKCHRILNTLLAGVDLSLAQHEVLMTIRRNPGLTQKEISEKLLVVKSNVSALIKKLEARGLVRRTPDADDSRNNRLSLTAGGERLVRRSFELQNRVVAAMTSELSDEELVQTGRVMRRVGEALDRFDGV